MDHILSPAVCLTFLPPGENRLRYFQLLMNGSYTPWTLPVGMDDAGDLSPHNLTEALLVTCLFLTLKTKNVLFCFLL